MGKSANLGIHTNGCCFVTIKQRFESSFYFFEMHYKFLAIIFKGRKYAMCLIGAENLPIPKIFNVLQFSKFSCSVSSYPI